MSDAKTIADTLTTVWEGSWGSISPSPHSVETLRLCKLENGKEVELISYPYRSLTRWSLKCGQPERLEIEAAGESIVITGRGLKRLAEALDEGQLRCVREQNENDKAGDLLVLSIKRAKSSI